MTKQESAAAPRLGSREAQRNPVVAVVEARRGQHRQSAEAIDLSPGGVRLRTLNSLRSDTVMWLRIGAIEPLEITVMWVDGFYAGCRFAKPLHPAVYQTLLDALAVR